MGLLDRLLRPQGSHPASATAVPTIPSTWKQPYALRAAGYRLNVVGESHYQDALEVAGGGRTRSGARVPLVTAVLVREPTNPHDHDAVRVEVGGRPVGYVPRDLAPTVGRVVAEINAQGRPATCRAWLTGGWERGRLDRGSFGIVLDLHEDLEVLAASPLMPFDRGRISVTGEESAQAGLEAMLGNSSRVEAIGALREEDDGRLAVDIDGHPVGRLTPKMSGRYRAWVREVIDAGFGHATCEVRIVRGAKKIEVFLKLADPWTTGDPAED